MARTQKNRYDWKLGVFALFIIFVIGSCSNGKRETKVDSQNRTLVERPLPESSRLTETQATPLYSSPERQSDIKSTARLPQSRSALAAKSSSSMKTSKPKSKLTTHPSQKRSYAVGPCPCSRALNCVGPRGGRYCITSGGNKRYR